MPALLIGMHAESRFEVVENKREGRREGSADFVKLRGNREYRESLEV
jgi:hypothetical protein